MSKIVKVPDDMTEEEVLALAEAFKNNTYILETLVPDEFNVPDRLSPQLQDIKSYNFIFQEDNSSFNYLSIRFTLPSGGNVQLPIVLFGIGNSRQVRFPLIMNGSWIALLTTDKASFKMGLDFESDQACDFYYTRFINWKRKFMEKIFSYYLKSDYCSGICWKIKEQTSNTRKVAWEVGFNRVVFDDHELYTSQNISGRPEMINYFKDCFGRWITVCQDDPKVDSPQIHANTILLIAHAIGYAQQHPVQGFR